MNELAVSIGVILFPGLIACVICDKIAAHSPRWGTFKYSIYSFIFGVLCYVCVELFLNAMTWISSLFCPLTVASYPPLHVWSIVTSQKADINIQEIAYATIAAFFVSIAATYINNNKFLYKIASYINVTRKYGDENLFYRYLSLNGVDWVYIRDPSTNQTYKGIVASYSENDHIQEIVLADVTVYEYETSVELYSLPSVYLSKPTGTFIIEAAPEDVNGKEDNTTT
ncbi:MAG: hypothetical protein PHW63_03215 [Alphaproteobacteria bacterium]|nr:hypothetical protein [Alphaproteobacteria bacterium]